MIGILSVAALGTAAMFLPVKRLKWHCKLTAGVLFVTGAISLVGYALVMPVLYIWVVNGNGLSANTALAFLALAGALLHHSREAEVR